MARRDAVRLHSRRQAGLTLIELVLVLAIILAAAGAVAVRASATADAARLRSGAEWTASVMRQAIRRSWNLARPVRIRFQPGTMNVAVEELAGGSWTQVADFFQGWLPSSDTPQGVTVSSTSYPSHTLVITPVGIGSWTVEASVRTTEGTVTLSTPRASLRVSTSRDGKVSIGDQGYPAGW